MDKCRPESLTRVRPARYEPTHELGAWQRFLSAYARLQLDLTTRVDELLALGVPDYRPAAIPDRLTELLDKPDWLGVGTFGPTVDEHRRLFELVPRYERWCAALDMTGIPASLQHDDVHDGNVFRTPDGGFVFLDWGDAIIGHPFGSLHFPLRVARRSFQPTPAPSELDKLRDAYLQPWIEAYDRQVVRRAADLALRVVRVGRVFTLHRALLTATEEERTPYEGWIGEWFREVLDVA